MDPNPGINTKILVGTFQLNSYDTRNIWYDIIKQRYIVTNAYGMKPTELFDNEFDSKETIINIYNSTLHYDINIENDKNYIKPKMFYM